MPRLLDLYCGIGGAGVGYARAGWEVTGVDSDPHVLTDYPFESICADVLALDFGWVATFDAVHASPPCQASSMMTKGTNSVTVRPWLHLDQIAATRTLLDRAGRPYVIENVVSAEVRVDLLLCGSMFNLRVMRHRVFELGGWTVRQPPHQKHLGKVRGWRHGEYRDGEYLAVYGEGGGKGSITEWQSALGIDWTADRRGLAEAIPPAYTRLIGTELGLRLARSRLPRPAPAQHPPPAVSRNSSSDRSADSA